MVPKNWASLLVLLVSISTLPVHGWTDEASSCSNFTIGVSLPLSGAMAEYGVAVMNGMALAFAERPQNFQAIRMRYQDNRYDPTAAISAFHRLRTIDKVNLMYVWGDHPAAATAYAAEKWRVPLVAVLTDPRPVRGMRYVLRFINPYEEYACSMLEYLRSRGYKRIGVVHVEDPYYDNLLDGLKRQIVSGEEIVSIANLSYAESDFKSLITKVRRAGVDVLGVYLMPGQLSTFYRQLAGNGVSLPTFGADVFENMAEIQKAGGAMEGSLYAHNVVDERFRRRYIEHFGDDYQIAYAANAYEFAVLAGELFGRAKMCEVGEGVINRLTSIAPRCGQAAGCYAIATDGGIGPYVRFQIAVKQIRHDKIVMLDRSAGGVR